MGTEREINPGTLATISAAGQDRDRNRLLAPSGQEKARPRTSFAAGVGSFDERLCRAAEVFEPRQNKYFIRLHSAEPVRDFAGEATFEFVLTQLAGLGLSR